MLKFIRKSLYLVSAPARVSPLRYHYLIQSHPFSSSLESPNNSPNQHSFTVRYLVKSCGFTPEKALSLSASKYCVKFEATGKPDSVLACFKKHGFTKTQITRIIAKQTRVLLCNPDKSILPKLEFFMSKGLSSGDVAKMVSASPLLLARSLEKWIIPSFNFFSSLLRSEETTVSAMKLYSGLLLLKQTHVTANIELLREAGVSNSNIMFLLKSQPIGLTRDIEWNRTVLDEVKKMGFDSSKKMFVVAVHVLRAMTKLTWEKKVEVYKKWGWADDDIIGAFKIYPMCMAASEKKINGAMDFFVNQMGWESSFLARKPIIIAMSLQNRIVPRSAVYQALLSKGLIETKDISLATLLHFSEMQFLKKVLSYQKEEAPELLKLYKENMDLAK
ncbi:hypothetical protein RHGRI_027445 [Rhododendron griersonianum]|uniref:Mitochondrial transcription termination factor family protein n=1 Tax=Rhododendron griersonianum TaxID=479676 RepID=A0AAV6IWR3_9ERIC|nr:hypothetical protein RHGRI_027445 [Rhododendron griersonianum]